MINVNKEKATLGVLCLLPFLAFLSLCYYTYPAISRLLLLFESGAFFLLLAINARSVLKVGGWAVIALNFVSVATTLSFHSGIGAALAFFNLLISMLVFNGIALEKGKKQILHFITAALILLFYIASNFGEFYGRITMRDLSGYFLNSNEVGMLLFALLLHAVNFVCGLEMGRRARRALLCALVALIGYLIYLTACRSALIALAVFIVLSIAVSFYRKAIPYAYYKFAAFIILASSLAFTVVYVFLSAHLDEIKILNKELFTGREIVWQSAFGLISESPIFGNGTDVLLSTVGGNETTSAHNTLLSIWYTLGVIPTLTTLILFVNRGGSSEGRKRDPITQAALISSLFICFFESFLADPNLQIFFTLLLISNVKIKEEIK